MNVPNTEDAMILQEMQQTGMDLTVPHYIDFFINFGKKKNAENMLNEVNTNDSNMTVVLSENETHDGWVLCCTIQMIPTHDDIVDTERALDKIAAKYHGESDGWGVLQPEP